MKQRFHLSLCAALLALASCTSNAGTDPATDKTTSVAGAAADVAGAAADAAAETAAPVNAEAAAFTINGGPFQNQRVTIAHPANVARPGAALGYWSAQPDRGTELDASHEDPNGLILRVPAAPADKPGTYPLAAGAVMKTGDAGAGDINLTGGTVTFTQYGRRLVGTFEGTGTYMDMQNGMQQVPVTVKGSFDLARGSNR